MKTHTAQLPSNCEPTPVPDATATVWLFGVTLVFLAAIKRITK